MHSNRPSYNQWLSLGASLASLVLAVAVSIEVNDLSGAIKALIITSTALSVIFNAVMIVTHPKGSTRAE